MKAAPLFDNGDQRAYTESERYSPPGRASAPWGRVETVENGYSPADGAVFAAVWENGAVVETYPSSPDCWSGERLLVTLGKPSSTFGSGSGGKTSHSIRDDYDNPEDLYEDNRDWYDDEDEAYEEWEND